jgi:hypothetical protein
VHGALANLPSSSSNVGWEVVVPALGDGGAVEGVVAMTIMASSVQTITITAPSQAAAAGVTMTLTDTANYDLSPLDTPIITGDWIDNGNDEESVSSRGCEERVPFQELIDLSITLM